MRDVPAEAAAAIWHAGDTAGVATVVRTFRSAPRPPGAAMVASPDGTISGSVSSGCIEAAVYDLATEVIGGAAPRLRRCGVSDDEAFAIGLACGGIIDAFVEPVSRKTFARLDAVADDIASHRPMATATVIAHPNPAWLARRLVVRPATTEWSLGSCTRGPTAKSEARVRRCSSARLRRHRGVGPILRPTLRP